MAEGDANFEVQHPRDKEEEERLKYLGFAQVAALHVVMTFANLYNYAKEKSGPLKPGVESLEGAVKTMVGPVYNKFHDVPNGVLKFVDHKVDESVTSLDNHVPPVIKEVSAKAYSVAHMAPVAARAVASEVHQAGVKETASELAKNVYTTCEPKAKEIISKYEPKAKELIFKYEPIAEQYAVSTWHKLNQLPLFPHFAHVMLPIAAYCAEKYNKTILSTAEKGYKVSSYMPLVPTKRIAEVFSNEAPTSEPLVPTVRVDKVLSVETPASEPLIPTESAGKVLSIETPVSEPLVSN